jgi:hypothetical protein
MLTGMAMKPFLERLAGGRRSFRDLGMGETAALSLSKGMRRGQGSPVNKLLKKPAREPRNERKGFMAMLTAMQTVFQGAPLCDAYAELLAIQY